MHNLPTLAKGPFRCVALVHPDDAARFGLVNGGRARIASATGRIEVVVEVTTEMMPGVVSVPHGWGHDQPGTRMGVAAERPGANLNALLEDSRRDPLSGNAVLGGVSITMSACD
jgi:anaerobic selenocysteine-containing dehydrogenase